MDSSDDSAPISGRAFGDSGNYAPAEKCRHALLGKGCGVMDNLRADVEARHAMGHVTCVKREGTDSGVCPVVDADTGVFEGIVKQ